MFYKYIDENNIKVAPYPLHIDGMDIFTNSEEIYNQQGYCKVQSNEYPQDGKCYKPFYLIEGNIIIQSWEESEALPE